MFQAAEAFSRRVGLQVPLLCGAMYPCSNPELVAAVSEAGGMGVVQPLSLVYVHGHEFRAGLRRVRELTSRPIALNVIVEQSSKVYQARMREWVAVALEEGVRCFVTSLGDPAWVVEAAHAHGGLVLHDVTERRWALKAVASGVDGLIAVNDRAGGHAGTRSAEALYAELADLGLPVLAAGGASTPDDFVALLAMGYAGVQMGTRFIATVECQAHADYKDAIVRASAHDIVLTHKLTGVPVAVIRTPTIDRVGTEAGPIARRLLAHPKTKHWMRTAYSLQAAWQLKQASLEGASYRDYWQAGKSVAGIDGIERAGAIVERCGAALVGGGHAAR